MLTRQEVFNKAVQGLRAQGQPAKDFDGPNCFYRMGDLKCAAGMLIADEHYDIGLERKDVGHFAVQDALKASGVDTDDKRTLNLVSDLQQVHDDYSADEWEYEWQGLARRHELEMP